jgi:dienelactone hydrolase
MLPSLLLVLAAAGQQPQLTPSKPYPYGRINAADKTWEDWRHRTAEQPPDFAALPSIADLPDPLNGVKNATDWHKKREWIRREFEHWVFGKMPASPGNVRAVISTIRAEGGITVREVRLEFGPDHQGSLRIDLLIPPGAGPFPVFLTNHGRNHPWIYPVVRRGYIACIYHAADPVYGDRDDSDSFIELYPDYDFSCLARWAWASMRAVDYLVTLPEVDRTKIAVAGHSRAGKAALLSAAFDERIGAVVASSGNTGECDPWRYTSDPFGNETIEQITTNFPHWFHPRLRFFAGREQKLPVDQNLLMAMVAPRGLLMYSSYSEHEGNSFGMEQVYRSTRSVYRFLGKPDNLWLHLRAGEHATTAGDVENFVDFLDTLFGRHAYPRQETFVNGYSFEEWKRLSGENIDPSWFAEREAGEFSVNPNGLIDNHRADILKRIQWALGEEPGDARFPPLHELKDTNLSSDGWISGLLGRPLKAPGMAYKAIPFGDGLQGDLYYPAAAKRKFPVVIWLHGLSYPTGYSRIGAQPIPMLVQRGFAVLAFDQIGFGTRVLEARRFYEHYPKWSLMGKMVADTRSAVDAAAALEVVDAGRIYVAGYDLGGKVGLFTAALDDRVQGLAVVCGLRPLRMDAPEKGTEGIRHYSHLHGLLPRYGFFTAQPSHLPLDDDDLLAMLAPRPLLAIAPTLDRYAPVEDVRRVVEAARRVWTASGKGASLVFETPVDFNRLTRETQQKVAVWLASIAGQ